MTDQTQAPTSITPELRNEFLAEIRDIEGYLSIIDGANETIKEITNDSKKKYGVLAKDMKAIAKKNMMDELGEDIANAETVLDWKQIVKENN